MISLRSRQSAGMFIALVLGCGCSRSPEAREAAFLKRGLAQQARKSYARAILEFKNAAQAVPTDAEPEYRLGVAYIENGQSANALAALDRAVQLNPAYAPAQLKLADLMLNSHDRELVQQAAHQLQSMLNVKPFDAAISDRLAMAQWSLGKLEDAQKQLQESVEKSPGDLTAAITLARLRLRLNDAAGAVEAMENAAHQSPHSATAAVALAELYILTGKTAAAEGELRRALSLEPDDGVALLSLASVLAASQRSSDAEALLRRLSELRDPAFNSAYGQYLWETGRHEAALAEFERQFRKSPSDRAARNHLIEAYVEMNRMADVGNLLAKVLKDNPKDTDALLQRSSMELQSGAIEEAEADLNHVIEFLPNSAQAHFALATVYKKRGQISVERQELNEALHLNPSLLPARLWLVQSLMVAEQFQAALDVLSQAPEAQQQLLAVGIERNWALLFLGRSREVRANLDRVLPYRRHPELVLQSAMLEMREGNYAAARGDAEEVLKQNPEEARAARVVVDSYVAQNQNAKAQEKLSEMANAHPGSAALQRLEAKWFAAAHRNAEARQALTRALAAEPKSAADLQSLAELDLEENRLEEARQELAQAIQYDPKSTKGLLLSAEVEDRSGNTAAAVARYREVLSIDANNLMALNNLANDVAAANPDEALSLAQRAMEAAPDNPGVEDTVGWMYYRKGLYQEAVQYLQAANSAAPNPRRRFHLGLAYMKLGDRARGQKLVSLAVQDDPSLARGGQIH